MHGLWSTDVCWWYSHLCPWYMWINGLLTHSCISISKKCVYFLVSQTLWSYGPDIWTVSQYLGVILDCTWYLKQVQNVMHVTKYNLSNLEYKKLPDGIFSKTLYDCHDHASPIVLHYPDPGNHHNTETCPFTVQASSRSWVENLSCIITATYLLNTKCSAGKTQLNTLMFA